MKIVTVDIETLHLDKNNARIHNQRNLEAIGGSIDEFGQVEPLVVQKSTGRVIGGNGRLEVLRKQGAQTVEIVEVDLDDKKSTALGLALNRTAELADWDTVTLQELTTGLEDFNLEGIGFDSAELDSILGELEEEPRAEPPEEFPEDDVIPHTPAVTKKVDIVTIGNHVLICGDCIEEMKALEDNSIDAICTDPPYGIGMMVMKWDCDVPGADFAKEALRVLKPGGHLVAFAATRTVHRLTVALEDAGFEIRDLLSWLTWQGFPKSHNISIQIDKRAGLMEDRGKGHSAYAVGDNFQDRDLQDPKAPNEELPEYRAKTPEAKQWKGWGTALKPAQEPAILCRKPIEGNIAANVVKWGTGGLNVDACRVPDGDPAWPGPENTKVPKGRYPANVYHCPKVSRSEREEGCEDLQGRTGAEAVKRKANTAGLKNPRAGAGRTAAHVKNHHPTVKPQNLMRWLVRLITPPGGTVLEPFAGSGTTLLAAERENCKSIGIEREPEYCDIARARLTAINGNA